MDKLDSISSDSKQHVCDTMEGALSHSLPGFITKLAAKRIESVKVAVKTAVKVCAGSFVLNLIFSGSQQLLWSLIRGIQFTVVMSLIHIRFPSLTENFLIGLMDIA